MFSVLFIPVSLGIASVLQNTLNRQIGYKWGLPTTILFNAFIFVFCGVVLVAMARVFPEKFSGIFSAKDEGLSFKWWYFLPGVFGYSIILGLPYAMTELGALKVFVGFVAAQVITSLLWDGFVDGIEMTAYRVLGATLSIAGVVLVSLR